MSANLDHVARPMPPWRDPAHTKTECGRELRDVASIISLDDMLAKVKREGQARAAFTSCMTCWQTASRHTKNTHWTGSGPERSVVVPDPWWENPTAVLARDGGGLYGPQPQPVTDELRAIGRLIAAHVDEFAALLVAVGEGDVLAARRSRPRKAATKTRGL
jgi:hypothetical protein